MLTCKQMTEMATDRAEGILGAPERERFDRHLVGCDGCRAYVRQLDLIRQALGRLPEPEISPVLENALMAQFDRMAPARFAPWPVAGTLGALGLLVAFSRNRSEAPSDWAVGALLAVAALTVASLANRLVVGVVVAAVSGAVAAALFSGRGGPLAADHGVYCLGMELGAAALVGGIAWLGARGGTRPSVLRSLAAGTVAGALAADAALQIMCSAADSLPHLFAFHVGGVLVVAGLAVAILRPARTPARS